MVTELQVHTKYSINVSLKALLMEVATGDHTVLVAKLTNSKQIF